MHGSNASLHRDQFMVLGIAQEALHMNDLALRSYAAASAAAITAKSTTASFVQTLPCAHHIHEKLGELMPVTDLPIPLTKFMYIL